MHFIVSATPHLLNIDYFVQAPTVRDVMYSGYATSYLLREYCDPVGLQCTSFIVLTIYIYKVRTCVRTEHRTAGKNSGSKNM